MLYCTRMKAPFSHFLLLTATALGLSSCSLIRTAPTEEVTIPAEAVEDSAPEPSVEQRAAALETAAERAAAAPTEEELLNTPAAAADEGDITPQLSTGGLRMRRFAPPEEAVSSEEGTQIPLPNAAELHGLRSPSLRGGNLPMDINGKISPETQE